MVEVVTNGGVLDKFAGDAVMAVFGAPRRVADHAGRALACAVAMQRRQATLNTEAEQQGLATFQIGIGVNTGTDREPWAARRLDYTVLGDAVNIAQRLQAQRWVARSSPQPRLCGNRVPTAQAVGPSSSRGISNRWRPTGSDGRETPLNPPAGPPTPNKPARTARPGVWCSSGWDLPVGQRDVGALTRSGVFEVPGQVLRPGGRRNSWWDSATGRNGILAASGELRPVGTCWRVQVEPALADQFADQGR